MEFLLSVLNPRVPQESRCPSCDPKQQNRVHVQRGDGAAAPEPERCRSGVYEPQQGCAGKISSVPVGTLLSTLRRMRTSFWTCLNKTRHHGVGDGAVGCHIRLRSVTGGCGVSEGAVGCHIGLQSVTGGCGVSRGPQGFWAAGSRGGSGHRSLTVHPGARAFGLPREGKISSLSV